MSKRVRFDLEPLAPFCVELSGRRYSMTEWNILAEKRRLATNITEFVIEVDNVKAYVTVVGDEDQTSGMGIHRGWYIVEALSNEEAAIEVELLSAYTKLYHS